MSEHPENLIIRAGSNPMTLPAFTAIREEINKINHPSQPAVNWPLIESLALTLFRTHGVDLQSAIYYTLARMQLSGLAGFTEGCELLAGVMVSQWDALWPPQPAVRTEMLDWFNTRSGNALRQHDYTPRDLRMIYRAERALQLIVDRLQQSDLKRLPKVENLLWFFQNTAKKLEQTRILPKPAARPVQMPPLVYLAGTEPAPSEPDTDDDAGYDHSQPKVQVRFPAPPPRPMSALQGFGLGLLLGVFVLTGSWLGLYRPLQQQLTALTDTPDGARLAWLYHPDLPTYAQQLTRLADTSPLAVLQQAEQLTDRAQKTWPQDRRQQRETQRWQQLQTIRRENAPVSGSWQQTRHQLQLLADNILTQERNRGSFTLSYLKTAIYQIQHSHNRDLPLEELLRQLSAAVEQGESVSPALIKKTDDRFNALLSQYYALQKAAGLTSLPGQPRP
ncbi:VasL domain-containing protein [Photorhabdus laumondii]|uniref:VasL domain-containing protein n=1 Tax=Photorhabdus laumondii TaxID=2218628 RepID=UPI0025AF9BF9|nr:VasL domain-containing protein [Photorhabdus laumondii]